MSGIYFDISICVRMNEIESATGELWMGSLEKTDSVQPHESIGNINLMLLSGYE